MRARTSPQVLHAQPFDGILARYVSMATGDCRNITRTDTHGYGLRVQVRPYRAGWDFDRTGRRLSKSDVSRDTE
jgi:hypothetical protein